MLLDDRAAAMMHVYKEQLAVGLDGIQIFIPSDRPFKIPRFAGISLKKKKKERWHLAAFSVYLIVWYRVWALGAL